MVKKRIVDINSLQSMVNIVKGAMGPNSDFAAMYTALDGVHMTSLRDFVYDSIVHKSGQVPRRKTQLIQLIVDAVKAEYTHQSRACQKLPARTEQHIPYATSDCQRAKHNLRTYRCTSRHCKHKIGTYADQVDQQLVKLRKLQYCSLKNVCNCPKDTQAQQTVEDSARICDNIDRYVTEKKEKPLYRVKNFIRM